MSARYALYYAPEPGSALAAFGAAWLGRDPRGGPAPAPLAVDGVSDARRHEITASPRRYGFHATLKPPFALAPGRTGDDVHAAVHAFAGARAPVTIAPLRLAAVGGFLALVPHAPSAELDALAAGAVRDLDRLRARPSAADLARRDHPGLDARERDLLAAWGYPYVLDRWRFHLTLTERLADDERERVRHALEPHVAPLCTEPLHIASVALFVEPGPGEPLRETARFPLAAVPDHARKLPT